MATSSPITEVSSARLRHLRVSPQKARLVLDLVRGKRAEDALNILRFSRKAVAKDLHKLLWSAVANAKGASEKAGERLDERELLVARTFADPGPSLKRIRANSMGRAFRVLHRTSHITFVLGRKSPAKPPAKASTETAPSRKTTGKAKA